MTIVQRRRTGLVAVSAFIVLVFALGVAVKLLWLGRTVNFLTNQAAYDAFYYHVPQINEFIQHGFSPHYHNFVAMTPGLHLFYAYAAKWFGFSALDYQSSWLFALHSIWMLFYLGLNLYIIAKLCEQTEDGPLAALPFLASNYPLFSWIWPTTDMPASVLYLGAVALELRPWRSDATRLLLYTILGAAGVLIRQHFAFLSMIPAAMLATDALLRRGSRIHITQFVVALLPILPSAAILAFFISIWGGFVPPDQAFHFDPLSAPVSLVHVLGFTGLLGAPFALSLLRLLRDNQISLPAILLPSAIVAGAAVMLLPLEPSVPDGRFGSLLWTIEARLHWRFARDAYLFAAIGLGTYIWTAVAALGLRQRRLTAAVVIFAVYGLTLLVQRYCFQRYVEEPVLLTLSIFVLLQARMPRAERVVWGLWFGVYTVVSWSKLFLGFGGFGPM